MTPSLFFLYLLAFAGGLGAIGAVLLLLYLCLLFVRGVIVSASKG